MSRQPHKTIDDVREICIDFVLPLVILAMLFTLMLTGIDGEVKAAMLLVIGWISKSGVSHTRKRG